MDDFYAILDRTISVIEKLSKELQTCNIALTIMNEKINLQQEEINRLTKITGSFKGNLLAKGWRPEKKSPFEPRKFGE